MVLCRRGPGRTDPACHGRPTMERLQSAPVGHEQEWARSVSSVTASPSIPRSSPSVTRPRTRGRRQRPAHAPSRFHGRYRQARSEAALSAAAQPQSRAFHPVAHL